jgi:hypothetical protein
MNRHQRRRAEARARKALPGYQHRLATAFHTNPSMADELRRRAVQTIVEHDSRCGIYRHRPCSCVPNISLVPFDGGDGVYIIDERGQAHRPSRQ